MTYKRVIPRDLFNEANLLKCLGRLWICLGQRRDLPCSLGEIENGCDPGDHTGEAFQIHMNDKDGSLSVLNLPFRIRGERFTLSRPLNSRDPWPLYCEDNEGEVCLPVFDDQGNLSQEFIEFACAHNWHWTGAGSPDCLEYRCASCGAIEERDRS
jgi:hypothetical protein